MKMRVQELIAEAKPRPVGRPATQWTDKERAVIEKIAGAIRSGLVSKNSVLNRFRAELSEGGKIAGLESKSVNAVDMALRELLNQDA